MVDNILNIVSSTIAGDLTFGGIAITMLVAIIFGLAISLTYMYTHKETYQQSMVITLSMLPVILSIIILFVGSNVARAFSLAGTLSIIRFRSAPGDPVDIGYIFFDIAAGLACGVGLYLYGAAFVLLLCLFMIILNKVKFAQPKSLTKSLKITIPENLDYQGIFNDIFDKYTTSYSLQRVKTADLGSLYELVYTVKMKNDADEKQFIDDIRCRNGNLNIILALAANEPYGAKK
jgi:hypothetical protein